MSTVSGRGGGDCPEWHTSLSDPSSLQQPHLHAPRQREVADESQRQQSPVQRCWCRRSCPGARRQDWPLQIGSGSSETCPLVDRSRETEEGILIVHQENQHAHTCRHL